MTWAIDRLRLSDERNRGEPHLTSHIKGAANGPDQHAQSQESAAFTVPACSAARIQEPSPTRRSSRCHGAAAVKQCAMTWCTTDLHCCRTGIKGAHGKGQSRSDGFRKANKVFTSISTFAVA
jgi:hypothetical protein